jgi:hypothetical protein
VRVISPQLGTETDYKLSHRDISLRRVSRYWTLHSSKSHIIEDSNFGSGSGELSNPSKIC